MILLVRRVLSAVVALTLMGLGLAGAYSYALPGQADARQALARSFDQRVFFAGEATSREEFSTAHGAYDSGVRAAGEAIEALLPQGKQAGLTGST